MTVPLVVYVLGLGIFAMTTSEFMVSGMLPELASELGVSISAIGYLVSAYAVAMAIGGPVVSAAVARLPRPRSLVLLLAVFLAGQVLGAVATGYPMLVVSRLVAGAAEAAFLGVGLTVAINAVPPALAGRATSVVLGGLMVSSVLGVPLATLLAQWGGWRGAFWAVAGLSLVAGLAVFATVFGPRGRPSGGVDRSGAGLRGELALFRNRRLWAVYLTSVLHIGGLFAAFSYFAAILIDVTGLPAHLVPVMLTAYGIAAVLGNAVVGRLADRHPTAVLGVGLATLAVLLAGFALGARLPAVALVAVAGIGLVGLPLNPAVIVRRMRVATSTPMINTVGASMANVGIAVGPALGGLLISAGLGLTSPLWIGAALAALACLTLLYHPPLVADGDVGPLAGEPACWHDSTA